MTSQIDYSKPTPVVAFTADVRNNFLIAYNEITALQNQVAPINSQLTAILALISGLQQNAPSLPANAVQFYDPSTNHFGGSANFLFYPATGLTLQYLAVDQTNLLQGSTQNQPGTYLVSLPSIPISSGQRILIDDNLTGTLANNQSFYASVWSERIIEKGREVIAGGDGAVNTQHFGLVHDVRGVGNFGDAAAVMHVIHMNAPDRFNRQDTSGFSYFHKIETIGTAYSSITEGTQHVFSSGVPLGDATCTLGTIASTQLTVAGVITGVFQVGQLITGVGVVADTRITSFGTGTGGAGTYNLSVASTVSPGEAITATGNFGLFTSMVGHQNQIVVDTEAACDAGTMALVGPDWTLTVAGTITGVFGVGQFIYGAGVPTGTYITALGTGTGGAGTYKLSTGATLSARRIAVANCSSYDYINTTNNSTDFEATIWGTMHGTWNKILLPYNCVIGAAGLDLATGVSYGGGFCDAGHITGTVLTVAGTVTGYFEVGSYVQGFNVTAGTTITSLGTGTGGAGTYNLSVASTKTAGIVTSSRSGNVVGISLNRHAMMDFSGADLNGQYYIKMSEAVNALQFAAGGVFGMSMTATGTSHPIQALDNAITLAVGNLNQIGNSVVGYPSLGFNIASGNAGNKWRYLGAAAASWIQFANDTVDFYATATVGASGGLITEVKTAAIDPTGILTLMAGGAIILQGTGTTPKKKIAIGAAGAVRIFADDLTTAIFTIAENGAVNATGNFDLAAGKVFSVNSTQVLAARVTGFTNAFSGASNAGSAYDTSTVTLQQLAERVSAIQNALGTHGLIGA